MTKTAATGAILSTAVAVMFTTNPGHAQMGSSSSQSHAAKVRCLGANDCKGQSACKTAAREVGNYPASAGRRKTPARGRA